MMISKKMANSLNEQVRQEFYAFWLYLDLAYRFEDMSLKVFARWFFKQAEEEKGHAMKIARYLIDQGASVKLGTLDAPKGAYKTAEDFVQAAVDHEIKVTKMINALVDQARSENDHATDNFLQWFVGEQVEEVSSTTELLHMVKMATTPGQLLMLENRVYQMVESKD